MKEATPEETAAAIADLALRYESALSIMRMLAGGEGRTATRCRRALLELHADPLLPEEVYSFSRAAGLLAAGAIYGLSLENRLRNADLLGEVFKAARTVEVAIAEVATVPVDMGEAVASEAASTVEIGGRP